MTRPTRVLVGLVLIGLLLQPLPALAQGVSLPASPPAPGPFGAPPEPAPPPNLASGIDLSGPPADGGAPAAPADAGLAPDSAAAPLAGPAASPTDPIADTGPAVGLLATSSPAVDPAGGPAGSARNSPPSSDLGPGPLPAPGPVVGPPLPGPGLPGPGVGVPGSPRGPVNPTPPSTSTRQTAVGATAEAPAAQAAAVAPGWLRRVLPARDFWLWLLTLLPLVLQALLAGLAALLSAWALPPGGVVWRLPPELTHQFGGVAQAHAALVPLADAALALIIALVGLGHILGPRAGLPVLAPREVAPRLAVAVLVAHGSLALGGWAIDLHDALLVAITPSTLAGWDPAAWQAGLGAGLTGLLYALLGLLLALGGWLRLALVDLLLVAAPLLAVLWVLPLTARWGEWALGLFGNLLVGQWLQVLALWLGAQLLAAPASDLQTAAARNFAAIAVLLVALRVPGLLPGPRGVGSLGILLGAAVAGRAVQAVWRAGQDRLLDDYLRRKALDLDFQAVAARVPDDPRPAPRVQSARPRRDGITGGSA